MGSAHDWPPHITRVPHKPKVAQFCAATWPNFTPALTALFQPRIQRSQIGEVWHALQHLMSGVADVLLDLAFLPSRRRIAKLGLINVVVRHGEEADIDLSFFAAANTINSCAHIVVNPSRRHAAKDPECMPMGIEQHLMGLQRIGTQAKGPAMRQLDMGDLELHPLATDDRKVLAPVKLEWTCRGLVPLL